MERRYLKYPRVGKGKIPAGINIYAFVCNALETCEPNYPTKVQVGSKRELESNRKKARGDESENEIEEEEK